MVSENLVLIEGEFDEFQRFCRHKGFDLSYYGPEIFGSKENIERYQFDSLKVIKLKIRRFTSKGIPYDVAEWQKEKWIATLAQLKDEFLKGRGDINTGDNKDDELDEVDKKRKWAENWGFFQLAATSMAAGILLVLVPSAGTVLPVVGFLLFLTSAVFLLAEWGRFSEKKWRSIQDKILWFGEKITPVFIMISVVACPPKRSPVVVLDWN